MHLHLISIELSTVHRATIADPSDVPLNIQRCLMVPLAVKAYAGIMTGNAPPRVSRCALLPWLVFNSHEVLNSEFELDSPMGS